MGTTSSKIERLLYIQKYIDLLELLQNKTYFTDEVSRYYKTTHKMFYKLFASKHGYMHIGLSEDGQYKKDYGYELYQLDYIKTIIETNEARSILELGCGQCSNLKYLASQYKEAQFYGLDLYPNIKCIRHTQNVTVHLGDYHNITQIEDESIDIAFAIETICYSSHKRKMLEAVYHKLKRNGILIIFDIFLQYPKENLSDVDLLYLTILENAYRLSMLEDYKAFRAYSLECGYCIIESKDLSSLATPYLVEIEKRMGRYLEKGGYMLKKFLALCPKAVVNSMPPGMMMRQMVEDRYLQYRLFCLEKQGGKSERDF